MSIRKNLGLWRTWVRSALSRTTGSQAAQRRSSRRIGNRSQSVEFLECRSLLAVTFQLNFINDGSIGFNDPTNGTARRTVAQTVATRLGNWFNHTATVQVDMRNDSNSGDNYLAEVSTPPPSQNGDGFFHTVMGQKIVSNGATDPNGATTDTTMTFNWANPFELADSFSFGEYDFQATMAHELLHAVGFTANLNADGSSAFGGGAKNWSKFDQFITNGVGAPVINQSTFVTDQAVWQPIRTAGTNKVFFGGPQTKAVTGGAGLKLYAPGSFDIASSISHSDDDAPEIASQTHIMTSTADQGRNARGPHISELAVFRDLGFDMVATTAQIVVTHSGGNTTVRERAVFVNETDTDSFTVQLSDKPLTDVVIDVRSMANGELKVDKARLTFTTSNWNTPQTVTVTGVPDGVVSENPTIPVRLSVIDALSDSNYDPVADVDVPVTVNQESVGAPTFTVNSTADVANPTIDPNDGTNTLREAVLYANQQFTSISTGTNTQIRFNPSVFATPQTITLTQGELVFTSSIELQGPGVDLLTISGNNASRIIRATGTNMGVRITDLTLAGGASGGANEGAVRNEGTGTMMLVGVHMTGNGQTALFNTGRYVGVYNSSFTGNNGVSGGAVFNSNGVMDIVNSTISGNTASSNGGGVWNLLLSTAPVPEAVRLTIINSTITGNRLTNPGVTLQGGGIGEFASGVTRTETNTVLINTILAGNRQGPVGNDIANDYRATNNVGNASLTMNVARSTSNLIGSVAFAGGLTHNVNGNLVGNGSGGDRDINTVLTTTAALNGGKTLSHALLSTSPAKNTGLNSILSVAFDGENLGSDQRGQARVFQTTTDIGSFETSVDQPPTLAAIPDQFIVVSTSQANIPLTVGDPDTPLGNLTLSVVSSTNTALIPLSAVTFGGSGANRTMTITPVPGQTGNADLVIRVSDGNSTAERTVVVRVRGLDYGDAPSTYKTLLADNGARHFAFGASLGANFDTEGNGVPSVAATGDDTAGSPDDEDGVTFGTIRAGQQNATVSIVVGNALPAGAYIDAWIDFNGDGDFEGGGERILRKALVQNGTNSLTFDVPAEARIGNTFARVRVSDAGVASARGFAPDGEVEDYVVAVTRPLKGDRIFTKQSVEAAAAYSVRPVDLDGDGDVDLIAALYGDGDVVWYENGGTQNFTKRTIDASFGSVRAVLAVDLDGDGDLDVAAAGSAPSNKLVWYSNNGNRTFSAANPIASGLTGATSISAADMDGDGDQDLLTSAYALGQQWHENLGSGNFATRTISGNAGAGFGDLVPVDLDRDGDMDAVGVGRFDSSLTFYRNNGSQVFAPVVLDSTLAGPESVQAIDFDRDGDMDLVVTEIGAGPTNGNVSWYENNGSQAFTKRVISGPGLAGLYSAVAADIDGDGDVDVAISVYGSPGGFGWAENNGSQSFQTTHQFGTTENAQQFITVGDVNGDGRLDFVTSTLATNTVAWWQQGASPDNAAPVLDNTGNVFAVLGAGARQSAEMRQGTLVSDLLARGAGGNPISDPDAGALRGIALTAVDQSLGNFQYTLVTNNPAETDWINVDAAGAVSDASALLLPTTARIRFNTGRIPHHASAPPFLALESKLDAGITFRAWDQTTGVAGGRGNAGVNGGATAFSTATETAKVYFEVRLFRHFNANASLNVYTLEAEFNALAAANNPAFEDRSTDAWTGFTVLLSNVPELATTAMYRMYYGVQFNANGTQIDMGYRYLTTNLLEAQALENSGPADRRPQRAGAYFREEGVNNGTGILGYIYTTQQPGTQQMRQIYRTDIVQKPTRPPGTSEGGTPTSFTPQENGDHVYTTNTAFETTKTGTWRVEDPRGFVRPLGGSGIIAPATSAGAIVTPIARSASIITVGTSTDLFHVGAAGATFTAILPTSMVTTSAVLVPDHVSTTIDVGLIAPPTHEAGPLPLGADPAQTESTDRASRIASEDTPEPSAIDWLFGSIASAAGDLSPW